MKEISLLHLKTSMKVKTTDGKVFQRVYNEPRGAPGNPLTRKELQEMFYEYIDYSSHRIPPENVEKIISLTEHLEEAEDVRSLIFLMTPRK